MKYSIKALIALITVLLAFQVLTRIDRVDIYSMTDTSHTFGYITNTNIAPHKTVTIPIVPDGNGKFNYLGNPSTENFVIFLAECYDDTSKMTLEYYKSFIIKHKEK